MSIVSALAAAISFAIAAVLQQEATQQTNCDQSLHVQLLVELFRQPRWVAGVAMLVCGFGLQALALASGPVALVQPIVATELAFAIPLAIWRRRRRAGRRELIGIALVLCGIAAFLIVASPEAGISQPSGARWAVTFATAGSVLSAVVLVAAAKRGPSRATLLGVAAGLSFALMAVLTKSVTHQLARDVGSAFASWQIYVLIALGISALVVSQSAYQAGPLALSMPAIALVEPVVAVVIGDTLFDEQASLEGWALALEAMAALVAVVGLSLLATSPTVLSIYEQATAKPRRDAPSSF
jgi:drug/metabolite transporter (DMT)-like permease